MSFKHEIIAGRSRLPRRKEEKKHVSLRYRCGLPPPNPTVSTGDFKDFIQNVESLLVASGEHESSNLRESQLQRN